MIGSKCRKFLKKAIQGFLHKFGFHLSRRDSTVIGSSPVVVVDFFGFMLYQNIKDGAVNYSEFAGIDLSDVGRLVDGYMIDFLIREIEEGDCIVDIGSNIGGMALLMSKLAGSSGTVIAFEPGPVSFALLNLNVAINNADNITIINKAVSSKSGTELLFICPTGESDNHVSPKFISYQDQARDSMKIETLCLDDFFEDDQQIDLVKIDIQGGEYRALQGMQKLLLSNPKIRCVVEYAPHYILWENLDQQIFIDFVRSLGFDIYDLRCQYLEPVDDCYLIETYHPTLAKYTNLLLKRS
jgi:FkbM family methyltransferase